MSRLYFFLLFTSVCLALPSYSQPRMMGGNWELGIFMGGSNYLGDLAPDIVYSETQPAAGLFVKRNLGPYVALALDSRYGWVSGHDANFESLKARNLSFRSSILEISPKIELNFFRFRIGLGTKTFTPFIYTGFAFFHFTPRAEMEGQWYDLQPMRTEGENVLPGAPPSYNLWSFAIPIGGGIKFALAGRFNLTLHADWNTTFTDYLDDVGGKYPDRGLLAERISDRAAAFSDRSPELNNPGVPPPPAGFQRGNTDTKDWYIFGGLTLSYVFPHKMCYRFTH